MIMLNMVAVAVVCKMGDKKTMSKNYMKDIAKILDVELDKVFCVRIGSPGYYLFKPCMLTEEGAIFGDKDDGWSASDFGIERLITGELAICKSSKTSVNYTIMNKNHMDEVAKLLGVNIFEEFEASVSELSNPPVHTFKLTPKRLYEFVDIKIHKSWIVRNRDLESLLKGELSILKSSKKVIEKGRQEWNRKILDGSLIWSK